MNSLPKYTEENLPEEERLVECPYNKAHKVVKHRMPKHLVKCRKSHSTAGTKECRFNSVHIFPLDEIALHEESCPDRIILDLFLESHARRPPQALADQSPTVCDDGGEWDDFNHKSNVPK